MGRWEAAAMRIYTNRVRKVFECMRRVFPDAEIAEEELVRVAEESYVAADRNYGIEVAIEWGRDFVWEKDVVARDLV